MRKSPVDIGDGGRVVARVENEAILSTYSDYYSVTTHEQLVAMAGQFNFKIIA